MRTNQHSPATGDRRANPGVRTGRTRPRGYTFTMDGEDIVRITADGPVVVGARTCDAAIRQRFAPSQASSSPA